MRLIHLSDLHFGTEVPGLLDKLMTHVRAQPADMVVISGDFTQRATNIEFAKAQDFIRSVGRPVFCVPGNHDVPRYQPVERMTAPFARYRRYINPDLAPKLRVGNICFAGLNTARRALPHWNWAHGAINKQQLDDLARYYGGNPGAARICVMHHPLQKVQGSDLKTVIFGGNYALRALQDMRVDLVLTGHVHHGAVTSIVSDAHETLFVSASTALSRRLRKSANGYNVITVTDEVIRIEIFTFMDDSFSCIETVEKTRST